MVLFLNTTKEVHMRFSNYYITWKMLALTNPQLPTLNCSCICWLAHNTRSLGFGEFQGCNKAGLVWLVLCA